MKKKKIPKVLIMGPQASGKGTQTHILSTWSGSPKMSMGDLLRDIKKEDSERGKTVKVLLEKGELVPDQLILQLVQEWTSKHSTGWVIDGFPRTMAQAVNSESFLKPDAIILLNISDADAQRRLSYRLVCSDCKTNYNTITAPPKNKKGFCDKCGGKLVSRGDDQPEVVSERIRIYHQTTEPIKEWFRERGTLIEIDASGSITDVAHDVQVELETLMGSSKKARGKWRWVIITLVVLAVIFIGMVILGASQ